MIAITGANGQLGRLVIHYLLKLVPAAQLIAAVRSPQKVADLAALGIEVRHADYDRPETLESAFDGVDKLLLISSSEVGRRESQHRNVIAAAKCAGVNLLAYTSILHCDRSPLILAAEHQATEVMLRDSALPYVLLRNGWYTENYAPAVAAALQHGVVTGCADNGLLSSASRSDYAEAAAIVLTLPNQAGRIYELAGSRAWSLTDLADEISLQTDRKIAYHNMSESEYCAALVSQGVPQPFAAALANAETGIAGGYLFDDGDDLANLINHSTMPLSAMVDAALKG